MKKLFLVPPVPDRPEVFLQTPRQAAGGRAETDNADGHIEKFFDVIKELQIKIPRYILMLESEKY